MSVNVKYKAIVEFLEIGIKSVRKVISSTIKSIEKSVYNKTGKIGGPGVVVEIDESTFGKVKYNRGYRIEGVWVFGMVERTPERRIVFVPVDDRKAATLEELLIKYVHREAIIHSDCFSSYSRLSFIFRQHKTVNHLIEFVNKNNLCHTNTIEGHWQDVKSEITMKH